MGRLQAGVLVHERFHRTLEPIVHGARGAHTLLESFFRQVPLDYLLIRFATVDADVCEGS